MEVSATPSTRNTGMANEPILKNTQAVDPAHAEGAQKQVLDK